MARRLDIIYACIQGFYTGFMRYALRYGYRHNPLG